MSDPSARHIELRLAKGVGIDISVTDIVAIPNVPVKMSGLLRLHPDSPALRTLPLPLFVVDMPLELFHRSSALLAGHMEHFFSCPYCWQEISMVLDPAVRSQTYVEDCEICCHPIQIRYSFDDGEIVDFEANILE